MSLKSIFKILGNTYNSINHDGFDKVDPNLIRYFRTEYGKDWKIALENHIYQKSIKNQKKAA
tara:strand:+ start:2041 stop:2226 length:186 start_codon:yes stop_codon:yes gene_type:complete